MRRRLAVAACVATLVALAACGGSSDKGTSAGGSSTTAARSSSTTAAGGAVVTLKNIQFNPANVAVKVGDKVTWTWADGQIPHTVTADDKTFDSGSPTATGTFITSSEIPYPNSKINTSGRTTPTMATVVPLPFVKKKA